MEHRPNQVARTLPAGAVIAATGGACGVLAVLVADVRGPVGWERPLIALLRRDPVPMARPILLLAQPIPFVIAVSWLAWMAVKSTRIQLALSGTAGCALAMVVTERLLKPLVGRHHQHWGSAVFPSGHVTAAAAWAMFAWLVFDPPPQLRYAFAAVPGIVGWAAVSTGMHYPADVLAGLIVGGVVVSCAVAVADRVATKPERLGAVARA